MAAAMDTAPSFVSAKAADVILSDVRATSITPESLRAINILMDELLWLILAHARSLNTTRLKSGVLKTIPTQLGKDAVLEAEIEIRAYRDKTQSKAQNARPAEDVLSAFPLQQAFDFLRTKCQSLSSFGDVEEDMFVEGLLLESYRNASPVQAAEDFTEPAPLYLTAVIEHVSQHLLSNVARVVARDSSRTSADLQNLYTSLCEDSLIYPVFKNMKVQAHIAQHLKPSTLAQKKSAEQAQAQAASSGASMSSQNGVGRGPASPSQTRPPPSSYSRSSDVSGQAHPTNGSNSSLANGAQQSPPQGSRSSNDSRRGGHQRSVSLISGAHGSGRAGSEDGSSSKMSVFDELLESGSTTKISLTPDRMRTFDVTKDKANRAAAANGSNHARSTSATAASSERPRPTPITTNGNQNASANTENGATPLTALSYRGAPTPSNGGTPTSATNPNPNMNLNTQPAARRTGVRSPSDNPPPVPPLPRVPTTPQRSGAPTQPPASASASMNSSRSPPTMNNAYSSPVAFPSGSVKKTRTTGRARNRESLDLDDIMNGDGDDNDGDDMLSFDQPSPLPDKKFFSASVPASSGGPPPPRAPKVSQGARDLMDFLDSAPPPEVPRFEDPMDSASIMSPGSTKSKSGGRFMSMVRGLRKGQSSDRLTRTRSFERLKPSTSRPEPSSSGASTLSSSPYGNGHSGAVPGQIPRHRSQHNLSASVRGVPPSSWAPPLPAPPPPPTPPTPSPIIPIAPVASRQAQVQTPTQAQTPTARTGTLEPAGSKRNAVVSPSLDTSPFPSPVSMQFGRGGGNNRSNTDNTMSEEEAAEPSPAPSRGSSVRGRQQQLKAVPEQAAFSPQTPPMGHSQNQSQAQSPIQNGNGARVNGAPLTRRASSARKPVPSVDVDPPSAPPSNSGHITPPARSPLRDNAPTPPTPVRTHSGGASAVNTAAIEPVQSQPTVTGSKAIRRPHTPTSPIVEDRGRAIAVAQLEEHAPAATSTTEEPASVPLHPVDSTDTEGLVPSRASPSPMPSTAPSSMAGEDWAERAADLRRLLGSATHVEEARLLVDMFLIQAGLPIASKDEPAVSAEPSEAPVEVDAEAAEHEKSIVELLLGDNSYSLDCQAPAAVADTNSNALPRAPVTITVPSVLA